MDAKRAEESPSITTSQLIDQLRANTQLITTLQHSQETLVSSNSKIQREKSEMQIQIANLQKKLEVLEVEKKLLMEQNCSKSMTIKRLIVESMLEHIVHKTFERINEVSLHSSLKQSSQNFKLDEFFLRSSRGNTDQLKKNLMNSTKKKNIFMTSFSNSETRPNKKGVTSGLVTQLHAATEKNIVVERIDLEDRGDFEGKDYKLIREGKQSLTPDFNKSNISSNDDKSDHSTKKTPNDVMAGLNFANNETVFEIKEIKALGHNFSFGFYDNPSSTHKSRTDERSINNQLNADVIRLLRIMEYVTIDKYNLFNQVKDAYDKIFMNNYNTQANVLEGLKTSLKSKQNAFFICMGSEKSGKTFTFQGVRKYPGILPHLLKHLDYATEKHVQVFDIRKTDIEDLLYVNYEKLQSISKIQLSQNISTLRISDAKTMSKIFRTIFAYRSTKKEIEDWTLVVKIADPAKKQCFGFVDACALDDYNAENLQVIRLLYSKDVRSDKRYIGLAGAMFDMIDETAKYSVNFISHIKAIDDVESIARLNKFLTG